MYEFGLEGPMGREKESINLSLFFEAEDSGRVCNE